MYGLKNKFSGFTLVELIIVIVILAILATIAFVSFQDYTKNTRDGKRMSDIQQIYNGLSIYKGQTDMVLLPDDYVKIENGGTIISYQGYAGGNILSALKVIGGKDPSNNQYYIYTTDAHQKKVQLMTYMETGDKNVELLSQIKNTKFISEAQAQTNSGYYQDKKIYLYGDKIGILTNNKVPIQETTISTGIDLMTYTGSLTTYFGGNVYSGGISSNTGISLINQINGVINNTIPCNGTTYNGYTITSLSDNQSQIFIKTGNITGGTQTGSIVATCNNGILTYGSENFQTSCTSPYVLNSNACVLNNYFSGDGSGGNPYRLNGDSSTATKTLATTCNYYNLNATTNNVGSLRGSGACGDGTKECLTNGVYLIDPDGNGGNNAFSVYCDMNIDSGGWTVIVSTASNQSSWDTGSTGYDISKSWSWDRVYVNTLPLTSGYAYIKYGEGNNTQKLAYNSTYLAYYNSSYAVQFSSDNCSARNGRCGRSNLKVSWGFFCRGGNPFGPGGESYSAWPGESPYANSDNVGSQQCNPSDRKTHGIEFGSSVMVK